ncbi:MAG: hypothetical protein E4H28_08325 [Gemmatimonadales bacterium]|nr:MAG: hypothetical protein E4H28_08325 [Gemmatimonadales bacterium]
MAGIPIELTPETDKRLKDDNAAVGAFGSLEDVLAADPDLADIMRRAGVDLAGLEGASQAVESFAKSEGANIKQLMEVRGRIERGERLNPNNRDYMKYQRKIFGSKSEAEKAMIREIDGMISGKLIGVASVRNKLMGGGGGTSAILKYYNDLTEDADRNKAMDSTEAYFKEHPGEGRVSPWLAELVRAGIEGVKFTDAIESPFVDRMFDDPESINSFSDWADEQGVRSVNADGTINDTSQEVIDGIGNIPGISPHAVSMASDLFKAGQARALSIQSKEEREDAEKKGFAGRDFAVTDAGVKHTSTSDDWRLDAENDFNKFRLFVAFQEMGVVTSTTQFEDDFDFSQALRIIREQGGSIANIKENRELWALATARSLDQYSGPFHTPHLFNYVRAQDPDLAKLIENSPDLRKLIGLEHLPSLGVTDADANRSDLRQKERDLMEALKELDGRTGEN